MIACTLEQHLKFLLIFFESLLILALYCICRHLDHTPSYLSSSRMKHINSWRRLMACQPWFFRDYSNSDLFFNFIIFIILSIQNLEVSRGKNLSLSCKERECSRAVLWGWRKYVPCSSLISAANIFHDAGEKTQDEFCVLILGLVDDCLIIILKSLERGQSFRVEILSQLGWNTSDFLDSASGIAS